MRAELAGHQDAAPRHGVVDRSAAVVSGCRLVETDHSRHGFGVVIHRIPDVDRVPEVLVVTVDLAANVGASSPQADEVACCVDYIPVHSAWQTTGPKRGCPSLGVFMQVITSHRNLGAPKAVQFAAQPARGLLSDLHSGNHLVHALLAQTQPEPVGQDLHHIRRERRSRRMEHPSPRLGTWSATQGVATSAAVRDTAKQFRPHSCAFGRVVMRKRNSPRWICSVGGTAMRLVLEVRQ